MLLCWLQALQSIAEFRGLRQLVLADCSAVTTGGLEQLSGLQGLHSLALLRCPRVGDKGMTVLHSLTCLTYLALTGCTKVITSLSPGPNWAMILGFSKNLTPKALYCLVFFFFFFFLVISIPACATCPLPA